MKNFLPVLALAFTATLFAQTETKAKKNEVPLKVKEAFQKEYPSKKAKWSKENDGYEAEFNMNGSDASAVYDKNGHRTAFEIDIKTSELPKAVLDYMKKNYPSDKITEAAKTTDDKNAITYEAEIRIKGKSHDILFDANGNYIKKE
jgi:hypothetical protein